MLHKPVLYLDLDDTLISWVSAAPQAGRGADEFVRWALANFEVRWLTKWCPGGRMEARRLDDLARLLGIPSRELEVIRGLEWAAEGSKLNGIAWLEHVVLRRPFVWLEDENGVRERERAFLARHQLADSYRHCNVTLDPDALVRAHAWLRHWLRRLEEAAA